MTLSKNYLALTFSAIFYTTLLFSSSVLAQGETTESEAPATSEPETRNATLLNFSRPDFPEELRAAGNEGWVKFNYIVDKNGKVKDAIVVSALGNPAFEKAALIALNNFEHAPALYKGSEVEQVVSELVLDFTVPQEVEGIDQEFKDAYIEIIDLLTAQDVEGGEAKLNSLAAGSNLTISELAQIEVIRAQIASSKGDRVQQIIHLRKALVGNGQYLPKATYTNILGTHFASALSYSLFNEAFDSFNRLEEVAPEDPLITKFALRVAPLKKILESDQPIRVLGKIGPRGHWTYTPRRRHFSFNVAEEGVKEFEPRCDRKNKRFEANTKVEWKIPDSWGFCSIVVHGTPGARFALMEYQPPEEE